MLETPHPIHCFYGHLALKDCFLKVIAYAGLWHLMHALGGLIYSLLPHNKSPHLPRLSELPRFSQLSPTTGLWQALLLGKILPCICYFLIHRLTPSKRPSLSFQPKTWPQCSSAFSVMCSETLQVCSHRPTLFRPSHPEDRVLALSMELLRV